jgi:hypothetical protein
MSGKSSGVPSYTQSFVPTCCRRWPDVLRVLHQLSLPCFGGQLDQGRGHSLCLIPMLLLDMIRNWQCIWTKCVWVGFELFASATSFRTWYCNNSLFELWCIQTMCELYILCERWMLNYIQSWLKYWKVWNLSWFHGLLGLCRLKYADSTDPIGVFHA